MAARSQGMRGRQGWQSGLQAWACAWPGGWLACPCVQHARNASNAVSRSTRCGVASRRARQAGFFPRHTWHAQLHGPGGSAPACTGPKRVARGTHARPGLCMPASGLANPPTMPSALVTPPTHPPPSPGPWYPPTLDSPCASHPCVPLPCWRQVIDSYLLDKYSSVGPTLMPPTPELRAKAALAARIHDLYIQPIQVSTAGRQGGRKGSWQAGRPSGRQGGRHAFRVARWQRRHQGGRKGSGAAERLAS